VNVGISTFTLPPFPPPPPSVGYFQALSQAPIRARANPRLSIGFTSVVQSTVTPTNLSFYQQLSTVAVNKKPMVMWQITASVIIPRRLRRQLRVILHGQDMYLTW